MREINALFFTGSVEATNSATKINKKEYTNKGRESVIAPKVRLRLVWSHLESLVSLGMGMALMLLTCGGGIWHMLHGQGIPGLTPQ